MEFIRGKKITDNCCMRICSNKKRNCLLVFLLLVSQFILFAESYSGSTDADAFIFRAPIWVFTEPVPGYFEKELTADKNFSNSEELPEGVQKFTPPKQNIIELSRFILSGMTYGFKFSYTPYDKKRQIKEYFEIEPKLVIANNDRSVKIREIKIEYPYCFCWAEYQLPESYRTRFNFWKSGDFKVIKGRGKGNRFDESKGIYDAYTQAIKNAIRMHGRKTLKNKPKEIVGEILIRKSPRLFVESGYFKAEIECYLKTVKVVPYTVF